MKEDSENRPFVNVSIRKISRTEEKYFGFIEMVNGLHMVRVIAEILNIILYKKIKRGIKIKIKLGPDRVSQMD